MFVAGCYCVELCANSSVFRMIFIENKRAMCKETASKRGLNLIKFHCRTIPKLKFSATERREEQEVDEKRFEFFGVATKF